MAIFYQEDTVNSLTADAVRDAAIMLVLSTRLSFDQATVFNQTAITPENLTRAAVEAEDQLVQAVRHRYQWPLVNPYQPFLQKIVEYVAACDLITVYYHGTDSSPSDEGSNYGRIICGTAKRYLDELRSGTQDLPGETRLRGSPEMRFGDRDRDLAAAQIKWRDPEAPLHSAQRRRLRR